MDYKSEATITHPAFIKAFLSSKSVTVLKGFGLVVAGSAMGKITASGKYAPVARTLVASTALYGQADVTVDDASVFLAGQTIKLNQAASTTNAETGVIGSIVGNVITLTGNLTYTYSDGDVVSLNDGSQTAAGLLMATIDTGLGSTTITTDPEYRDHDNAILTSGDVYSANCYGLDAIGRAALNAQIDGNITFCDL